MRRLILLLPFLFTACVDADKVAGDIPITNHVDDWRDEVIYQLITDRFANGDINNDHNADPSNLAAWHGGDFQGIIDKIPYLKELGVTTLWISPVVKNVEEDAGIAGYHGYWTQDYLSVNPHFGDLAKLREMVQILHDNDIKVILDIVANHVGQLFYYDINKNGQPDESVMGSSMDCYTYCQRIMTLPQADGAAICEPEYSNDFTAGACWGVDGCENKPCFDTCMARCADGYPQKLEIKRYSEWDPDFDPRGVMSFSEAGESGLAPVRWIYMPEINRVPPLPPEFQNEAWYNRRGRIVTWDSPYQVVRGDFPGGLKDLDTTRDDVRKALIRVYQYWIAAADLDGFRIDTIKHVEHEFWRAFTPSMREFTKGIGKKNFFIFGEAFDGDDALIGSFTKNSEMDSVFYFSQKFQVFDAIFKWNGPTRNFETLYNARAVNYGTVSGVTDADGKVLSPQKLLVNFMDNHDLPRFLYERPDGAALRAALSLLLTMDGIPCIYYGTEQNFEGGNDPANRENLAVSNYDTQNATFRHIAALTALRRELEPLRRGDLTIRWTTDHTGDEADAGMLAFERTYKGRTALVVLNTHPTRTSETSFDGNDMRTAFPAGTKLINRAPGGSLQFTVGTEGALRVSVPPRTLRVLTTVN